MGLTERHWFEDEEPELTENQLEDLLWENIKIFERGYQKGFSDGKLAILREQEPVIPKNGKCPECGYTVHRINYDGPYNGIRHEWFRFCPSCGKAVNWDE